MGYTTRHRNDSPVIENKFTRQTRLNRYDAALRPLDHWAKRPHREPSHRRRRQKRVHSARVTISFKVSPTPPLRPNAEAGESNSRVRVKRWKPAQLFPTSLANPEAASRRVGSIPRPAISAAGRLDPGGPVHTAMSARFPEPLNLHVRDSPGFLIPPGRSLVQALKTSCITRSGLRHRICSTRSSPRRTTQRCDPESIVRLKSAIPAR